MVRTGIRVIFSLLNFAILLLVLQWVGFEVKWIVASAFVLALCGGLAWLAWFLFKKGSTTSRVETKEPLWTIGVIALVLLIIYSGARDELPILKSLGVVAVCALAIVFLMPQIAQMGIQRWKREQRRATGSGMFGKARFVIFDAAFDDLLYRDLLHPWGSGPMLGFYEAKSLPTFFHRLLYWVKHIRNEAWNLHLYSYRIQPLIYKGPSHLLTIAPARSGKGSCVIIPNLLTLKQSIICIDPKGENAAVTRRQRATFGNVYLLNPYNEHGLGTSRFNPLAHLDINDPNIVADVAGISEALIISEGKEPFFTDSARDLVHVIILHLLATKGNTATLGDMRRLLTLAGNDGDDDRFAKLISEMTQSKYSFISQPAARFGNVDRTTLSIIQTAITQTKFLDDPEIVDVLSVSDFNMRDLKTSISTVYIILPSRHLAPNARFFRLLVVAALDQLTALPGGNRVTLILDEFAQLGHLSAIETALGLAAGYNVQLWPFLQDLNQLQDIYKDRWQTFMANAGVVQWFAPNDMNTAEYLSNRLGRTTVPTISTTGGGLWAKLTTGSTGSTTRGETGVPLQSPQELMAMDKHLTPHMDDDHLLEVQWQILTVAGMEAPIRCLRAPYYSLAFKTKQTAAPRYEYMDGFMTSGGEDFDENPFHERA